LVPPCLEFGIATLNLPHLLPPNRIPHQCAVPFGTAAEAEAVKTMLLPPDRIPMHLPEGRFGSHWLYDTFSKQHSTAFIE
jgi:hypothetical protein